MPRKKATANNGGGGAAVPQGRRTRRQTMQMQASPESNEVAESPPDTLSTAGTEEQAAEAIIAAPPMTIEDTRPQDKGNEEMQVEYVPEVGNIGPAVQSVEDSFAVMGGEIPAPAPYHGDLSAQTITTPSAVSAMAVPQSETDLRLVNEIGTAIEKISIASGAGETRVISNRSSCIDSNNSSGGSGSADASSNSRPMSSTPSALDEDSKEIAGSGVDLDTTTEDDSLSIRRSSRIKTITKTKQKSRGHGLVRTAGSSGDSSLSTTSNHFPVPQPPADSVPPPVPPVVPHEPSHPAPEQKPQKIKSRWLDSAKRDSLDLNNSLSIAAESFSATSVVMPMSTAATSLPQELATDQQPISEPVQMTPPPAPIDYFAPDPEVIECLKQLDQIKDNIYNCERNISKEAKKMTCDCFLTADEKAAGELGCGEDCLNRLLMIECGSRCVVGDRCTNRRFQSHQYAPVVVFKTEMKGFGLRAASDIQGGEFIMEYVGEVLNAKQFDKRANAYSKIKNKHYYFMALRSDAVIDATGRGNISRFINHSCDPNAETQKWTVNGELRIGFFTTRSIAAGEEVTFDYQYQRYGKEAQRCYCEAANCRGWIGEEPSDSEEEEEGEEEADEADDEEVEESEEVDAEGKKKGGKAGAAKKKGKAVQRKIKTKVTKKKEATKTPKETPKKPRKTARSRRQEILDDLDLDAEIDALAKTGLKNQAHTLKLSRMMVRAKLPRTRLRLLALIQGGEGPCRRLFLDYHGLRLLHGWMTDAHEQKDVELKLEIVRTLDLLPIPNKTMLKDSHVLTAVANYGALKLDSEKKEIVSEEGPVVVKVKKDKKKKKAEEEEVKKEPEEKVDKNEEVQKMEECESTAAPEDSIKMEVDGEEKQKAVVEADAEDQLTEVEQAEIKRVNLENEMRGVCKEMILKWVQLPEVFRIPKKERIEQMKEHEREADMRFMTLGLQNDDQEKQNESRFKGKGEDIKWVKKEFKAPVNDGMSKNQRRRLFAMQVEEQRRNEQRMDAWQHHEFRCNFFGLDPFRVRPEDVPSWVDLENRQWFTYDLTEVPTPPNYMHVTMKPTQPERYLPSDYDVPKLDLPEGWEYALDPRGRLFYFHKKIRIPQWEVPIKLLPLTSDGKGGVNRGKGHSAMGVNGLQNGLEAMSRNDDEGEEEYEEGDRNDDSSTTDTCDSDEEEMVKRINRIKKLHKIGVAHSTIVKLNLHERNSDDEVTREEVTKAEEEKASSSSSASLLLGLSKRLPTRESLVEFREISPRREEDRLYGQAEMKRYKETKEKFKQRKEMLKRRKLEKMMRAGLISSDPEKRMSFRSIQITDDELYDETDDEQQQQDEREKERHMNGGGGEFFPVPDVQATTTDPLIEKIVLGNSRVDELDEPHKYNEMTRLKIRERNAKRSRALKVQMKLKKMKMDEEHGEGNIVNGLREHQEHSAHNQQLQQLNASSPVQLNGEKASSTPLSVGGGSASSISSEKAKRIKDKFRSNIAGVIVQHLSPYRRDSCPIGRIANNEDFKHLAKKLTHFVLVKELKHCATVSDLSVSDSVKQKTKEFIRKYMSKYGTVYTRQENEPEY